MTDRDPLRPILRRQASDTNVLYRTLGDALENAIARQTRQDAPGAMITERDRAIIMREVSRGLDIVWGAHRNDPNAAIRTVVLRDTTAARFAPLDEAVRAWRERMSRELRRRVEEGAQRG